MSSDNECILKFSFLAKLIFSAVPEICANSHIFQCSLFFCQTLMTWNRTVKKNGTERSEMIKSARLYG